MNKYVVGVFNIIINVNTLKIVEASNEIYAILEAVHSECREVKYISKKLLDDYKTVEEMKKYFVEYWRLGLSDPYKLEGV
jgi:hypothetical protein